MFDIPFDVAFSTDELSAWLEGLGFLGAATAVRANELVGADLVGCDADDLAEVLELDIAEVEHIIVSSYIRE